MSGGTRAISVVIPCFADERFDDVLECVAALRRQTLPPTEVVVVVDNNVALLERLRDAVPDVSVIANRESRGSSGARNTGIESTRGEIVAFFDDDAAPEPDCLARLAAQYVNEDVVGVGGGVVADWYTRRPPWFPAEFDWVVGCTYRGFPTRPAAVRNLIGANMSFRRYALEAADGFSAEMARRGRYPLGVDDTELCIRIQRILPGGQLIYEPEARALHKVPRGRESWRYFRTRCLAEGRAKAALMTVLGAGEKLSTERSYVARILPTGVARGVLDAMTGRDRAGLKRSLAIVAGLVITSAGYAFGRLRTMRPRPEPGLNGRGDGLLRSAAHPDPVGLPGMRRETRAVTRVPILLYHSVSDDPPAWIQRYCVAPDVFSGQLELIVESGMTALSVAEYVCLLEDRRPLPDHPVVITFDDGLADFQAYALPALRRAGLPATLFVTTGFLEGLPEGRGLARPSGPWLDPAALVDVRAQGIEIGAHTHSHPQLDTLPVELARFEIVRSKEILENLLGAPVPSFAYPYGYHGPVVHRLARGAGFASACAVKNALSFSADDPFALARLTIRADTTLDQLTAWLDGRGAPLAPRRERARTRAWRAYRRGRAAVSQPGEPRLP
jgi:peptidoglycan/xylan/chitin deacetylase (PgdA/CDA1 family)/GT2 family glycosyltransferase